MNARDQYDELALPSPVCQTAETAWRKLLQWKTRADAAIAELDAENTELRKQNEILATARRLESVEREQAEAELAALKARRCWTCGALDGEDGKCRSFSDVFREYMQDKDGECSCTLWEAAP